MVVTLEPADPPSRPQRGLHYTLLFALCPCSPVQVMRWAHLLGGAVPSWPTPPPTPQVIPKPLFRPKAEFAKPLRSLSLLRERNRKISCSVRSWHGHETTGLRCFGLQTMARQPEEFREVGDNKLAHQIIQSNHESITRASKVAIHEVMEVTRHKVRGTLCHLQSE